MHKTLNASLNGNLALVVWIASAFVVQIESLLLHSVRMSLGLVTLHAKVEVVAFLTVITRFDALGAVVASVHKLVLALRVKLVQQNHRRVHGASQT